MTSVTAGSLLDDGIWHDVSLERRLNKIAFTIDRVELQTKVKGDFQILDLDRIVSFSKLEKSRLTKSCFVNIILIFFVLALYWRKSKY